MIRIITTAENRNDKYSTIWIWHIRLQLLQIWWWTMRKWWWERKHVWWWQKAWVCGWYLKDVLTEKPTSLNSPKVFEFSKRFFSLRIPDAKYETKDCVNILQKYCKKKFSGQATLSTVKIQRCAPDTFFKNWSWYVVWYFLIDSYISIKTGVQYCWENWSWMQNKKNGLA